jgi:methylenetetrahydrofolate--tRNA-(uracil-5-)-methyltransferase
LKARPNIFFAGQITGVEGYTESMAVGLIAAKNAARLLRGQAPLVVPDDTMIGALIRYITHPQQKNLQPINANWGIIAGSAELMRLEKEERRKIQAARALKSIAETFPAPIVV